MVNHKWVISNSSVLVCNLEFHISHLNKANNKVKVVWFQVNRQMKESNQNNRCKVVKKLDMQEKAIISTKKEVHKEHQADNEGVMKHK